MIILNKKLIIIDDFFISNLINDLYSISIDMVHSLKEMHIPLWTTLIYCGLLHLTNTELGIIYPLNIIFFDLLPFYLSFNISLLLKFFTAAFFLSLYPKLKE